MADSVGVNRHTGDVLTDWDHVSQSIIDLMTTPIGTRVMRRDYGSDIPNLIDRPQGRETVLEVAMALGEALEKWEPRFRLVQVYITDAGPDGQMTIAVKGNYYPRGHLGDFDTVITDRDLTLYI
jgi:phage baseplate assembly protein W